LIEAFAQKLRIAFVKLSTEVGVPVPVLFTAHSVPCRTVQSSLEPRAGTDLRVFPSQQPDPYAEEAKRTAALVAESVPEIPAWWFAFQSQGASGGPWIGPTVEATLDAVAASGEKIVLLQPIGFLCDHVEILFDVDHLFRDYAAKIGIRLERPESLNASALLTSAIADLACKGLARLDG
jgi:ferrochelatase